MAESKGRKNYYEAMFLVSQASGQDLSGCVEHLMQAIARAHGEVIAFRRWDERRLAYEIKKYKRGVYFLVYFEADPAFVADMERFLNLSETVLRFMVTRVEHMTLDQMQAADDRGRLRDEANIRGDDAPKAETPEPVAGAVGSGDDAGEGDGEG